MLDQHPPHSGTEAGSSMPTMRPLPEPILKAQQATTTPNQKVIAMLDARRLGWEPSRGNTIG
jgi:hypothetical protein